MTVVTSTLRTNLKDRLINTPFWFVAVKLEALSQKQLMELSKVLDSIKLIKNVRARYIDPMDSFKVTDFLSRCERENENLSKEREAKRLRHLRAFNRK